MSPKHYSVPTPKRFAAILAGTVPLHEMVNSYRLVFGPVPEKVSPEVEELTFDLLAKYSPSSSEARNLSNVVKALGANAMPLSEPDKAYIMDKCFHHANENFYEYEDAGEISDADEAQDDYLELMEKVLKRIKAPSQPMRRPGRQPMRRSRR